MEAPKVKKRVERTIGLIGISILLVLGIYFLAMSPLVTKVKTQMLNYKAQKLVNQQKQKELDNLSVLKDSMTQNKDEVNALKVALPKEPDIPDLLVQLNAIAASSKLKMVSFTPSMTAGATSAATPQPTASSSSGSSSGNATQKANSSLGLGQLVANLTMQGQYEQFEDFLIGCEKNLRPIIVQSVNLSQSADNSLNVTLAIMTYYQK